ncbi:IS481 family transposase [Georgenia deserti]|uniref:IS481 family transposase n=1 Tax=Georgenia deserti TaxID=2093781 RepID=A0ABW4LB37_9MICO
MSKRRLVIEAVVAGASQSQVARTYGVSQGWISRLMSQYETEGRGAFTQKSRRPKTNPAATRDEHVALVLSLRQDLTRRGLDAGADTIGWHLHHHHGITLPRATINRILHRAGLVRPEPRKRPKSSYIRFQAEAPNQTWQSDFTHYELPDGTVAEIITWLDDHSRYALHITAHTPVTAKIVADSFRHAAAEHGVPASTLTDNGMVYTTRFAGGRGGKNDLEHQLQAWNVEQKNSRPAHPTTCGKVERFQQTMKNYLAALDPQPETLTALQDGIDGFKDEYNHHRPHRSLPHRATPAAVYNTLPKAAPLAPDKPLTHERVREDIIDNSGKVTLRVAGRLRHIGVGRTHARTHVLMLVQDLHVTIINHATGEILRELTIDLSRNYQPQTTPLPK